MHKFLTRLKLFLSLNVPSRTVINCRCLTENFHVPLRCQKIKYTVTSQYNALIIMNLISKHGEVGWQTVPFHQETRKRVSQFFQIVCSQSWRHPLHQWEFDLKLLEEVRQECTSADQQCWNENVNGIENYYLKPCRRAFP